MRKPPLGDLPGVRIRDVKEQPPNGFDVEFQLESGNRTIPAFGEIKTIVSPKILEEIAPWMGRMRAFRNDAAFLLICPFLPPRSQTYCMQNQIDFLDLAGNVSINIPGTFTLQRLGMRGESSPGVSNPLPATNVFSGRSSRVRRVLLERIKPWTLTEIANELQVETNRFAQEFSTQKVQFTVSFSAISKALASLEEQLWIRRQNSAVTVPEPRRLLLEWGEKYKERYRWRLRSSFETSNPFGPTPAQINNGLESLLPTPYAFTSAAAAADAPFIDIDAPTSSWSPAPTTRNSGNSSNRRPAEEHRNSGLSTPATRASFSTPAWSLSARLEYSGLSRHLCPRWPRLQTSGASAQRGNRGPLKTPMIPEPQRAYVLELLAASQNPI